MSIGASIPDQLGQFQVLGLLGSGGMGEIFLGRRLGPGGFSRAVVLKRLLPHLARLPVARRMFLDEARIVARIRHRNVVQVQELGEDGDQLFFAMEFLEGETLAELIRHCARSSNIPPYREVAYMMAEVATGLSAVHTLVDSEGRAENVVHRDIKLSNVFVTYDGQVKVIDFGIAKAEHRLQHTESGAVRGTSAYMSPEQLMGHPIDHRSDIWSLGVVLFEASTLRRLFRRKTEHQTHEAILRGEVAAPASFQPDYPPGLSQICLRCLQRDPAERYQDAETLRLDLLAVTEELPGHGPPREGVVDRMQRYFQRRIDAQRRMLRLVERGESHVEVVTPPLTHSDFELANAPDAALENVPPTREDRVVRAFDVVEPDATIPSGTYTTATAPRRAPWVAVLAVLCLASAAIIGWAITRPQQVVLVPTVADQTVPAPDLRRPDSGEARPSSAVVRVETAPPGAAVTMNGASLGVTPLMLNVPNTQTPMTIAISRDGYEAHKMTIVPSATSSVMVTLRRRVAAPATPRRRVRRRPSAKSSPPPRQPPPDDRGTSDYRRINDWHDFDAQDQNQAPGESRRP